MEDRVRYGGRGTNDADLAKALDAERADPLIALVDENDFDILDVRMRRNMIFGEGYGS